MSRMQERMAALTNGNTISTEDVLAATALLGGSAGSGPGHTQSEAPDLESRISLG